MKIEERAMQARAKQAAIRAGIPEEIVDFLQTDPMFDGCVEHAEENAKLLKEAYEKRNSGLSQTERRDLFETVYPWMFVRDTPKAIIVTTHKRLVDWLLTLNTHNRRVSKPTISAYSQDMANGNWPLVPNGIGISKDGILIDGQHRLLANAKAGYPPVQMLIVSGLDMGAQKMIDQHNKRNMSAVFNLAFNVALSSGKAGTIRLLSAYDRGNAQRAEDFAIISSVLRPSVAEASATFDKYGDRILKIRDGDRGFSAAFWSVIIYAIEHGADEQKTMDFVDRCKSGNNLTAKEPARRWRRIFIEGYSPVVNGKAEQFSQRMTAKWTAILLFKHLGIDRLEIDSSNSVQEGMTHA